MGVLFARLHRKNDGIIHLHGALYLNEDVKSVTSHPWLWFTQLYWDHCNAFDAIVDCTPPQVSADVISVGEHLLDLRLWLIAV